jgi:hypothetical protein
MPKKSKENLALADHKLERKVIPDPLDDRKFQE